MSLKKRVSLHWGFDRRLQVRLRWWILRAFDNSILRQLPRLLTLAFFKGHSLLKLWLINHHIGIFFKAILRRAPWLRNRLKSIIFIIWPPPCFPGDLFLHPLFELTIVDKLSKRVLFLLSFLYLVLFHRHHFLGPRQVFRGHSFPQFQVPDLSPKEMLVEQSMVLLILVLLHHPLYVLFVVHPELCSFRVVGLPWFGQLLVGPLQLCILVYLLLVNYRFMQ